MKDENNEEMKIDSFKLYETSKDGIEKEINGKKYINDFEMYPEETE